MARKGYRIAEVALRVDDLERTAAFYQEVLGFAFHKREETVIFLEVGPLDSPLGAGGHPQLFALFHRPGQVIDRERNGFDHIAFEVSPA